MYLRRSSSSHLFSGLLLLLSLLRVTEEEQVDHDVPLGVPGDGATETEHLKEKIKL